MLSTSFDLSAHMSALQNMIDEFQATQKSAFLARVLTYRYLLVEGLALLLLIVFLLVWFERRHKKQAAVA